MKNFNLIELSEKHDYYCSHNYFTNDRSQQWESWEKFYEEFWDRDVDYNLVFRFDIDEHENGNKTLNLTMIHQRKGILAKHYINNLEEKDAQGIQEFLKKDFEKMKNLWKPFTL